MNPVFLLRSRLKLVEGKLCNPEAPCLKKSSSMSTSALIRPSIVPFEDRIHSKWAAAWAKLCAQLRFARADGRAGEKGTTLYDYVGM